MSHVTQLFNTEHDGVKPQSQQPTCRRQYGHVIDRTTRRNVTICGDERSSDEESRVSSSAMVYISSSNLVHVQLNASNEHAFIVRLAGELIVLNIH